jgi:outer membrane protein OmpA-like peptidoglycan-associated protein
MNSCATIAANQPLIRVDASRRAPAKTLKPAGRLGIVAICAVVAVVSGCSTLRPHPQAAHAPPAARPVAAMHRPSPKTKQPPAAATASTPAAIAPIAGPADEMQQKERLKSRLAADSRTSLALSDVGYYMDVLQGRLTQASAGNFSVARSGDRIDLDLPRASGFSAGSDEPNAGMRKILAPIAKVLVEYDKAFVTIRVRSDVPSSSIDSQKAQRRAVAIARAMTDAGMSEGRLLATIQRKETPAAIQLRVEPVVHTSGGH